jgi:hypothetical protein
VRILMVSDVYFLRVSAVIAPSSAMKQALAAYGVSSPIYILTSGLQQPDRTASRVLDAAGKPYAAGWGETKMECEILQLCHALASPNGRVRDYAVAAVSRLHHSISGSPAWKKTFSVTPTSSPPTPPRPG